MGVSVAMVTRFTQLQHNTQNPIIGSRKQCTKYITTLSGGFLVTNWLVREQQMLRDIGFSVFC